MNIIDGKIIYEKLEPCPFCGNAIEEFSIVKYADAKFGDMWAVSCPCCGASGGLRYSREEARDAWKLRLGATHIYEACDSRPPALPRYRFCPNCGVQLDADA